MGVARKLIVSCLLFVPACAMVLRRDTNEQKKAS